MRFPVGLESQGVLPEANARHPTMVPESRATSSLYRRGMESFAASLRNAREEHFQNRSRFGFIYCEMLNREVY